HSKEMNVIHAIVAECEKGIAFMHQVHDFTYGDERHWNKCLRFVLPTLEVEIIW
ncbi:DNA modification methylase, partial [Klebsiella pneumoniae]